MTSQISTHRPVWAVTAAIVVLAPILLAGCGTAVGAGAGGYAGNRLTHGSTLGTVGGAVAGGVLGHAVTGD